MGGLLILTAAIVPTLLWARLTSVYIWIAVLTTIAFGAIGFADDYLKITRRSHHGLLPRYKLSLQLLAGAIVGVLLLVLTDQGLYNTRLVFPIFKRLIPDLGLFYLPFAAFVLAAESNAVNLTDGLDGLAISIFAIAVAAYTALCFVTGNRVLAEYLLIPHFSLVGELTIFCGALVGASLGFLWYNSYPAEIFMGDVGSLSLGASLGIVAILIKQELLLPIVGGVFVLEALSVVLQVAYFKATAASAVSHVAAAPSLRTHRLERAQSHRALRDRRDHLCAVQPRHAEAAVMDFSVEGQRVTVVGAARSGTAAAELLASKVRALRCPTRTDFAGAEGWRTGIALERGGHVEATFAHADSRGPQSRRAADLPVLAAARARACQSSARWSWPRAG
jgi:phospho-N-acetylmuramoyl-pentapeptide-transferase